MVPFSSSQHQTRPTGSRVLTLTALESLSLGTEGQDRRRVSPPRKTERQKRKDKGQSHPAGFYALLVQGFLSGQQA